MKETQQYRHEAYQHFNRKLTTIEYNAEADGNQKSTNLAPMYSTLGEVSKHHIQTGKHGRIVSGYGGPRLTEAPTPSLRTPSPSPSTTLKLEVEVEVEGEGVTLGLCSSHYIEGVIRSVFVLKL